MYTHTKLPKWSQRTSFTTRSNGDGALQRPMGITTHSKAPNCVLNAVFSISSSWILIWWNPLTTSIFEKYGGTPQCTQDGLDRW